MAASDAKYFAIKNQALRVTFPIYDNTGALVPGAAGLDSEVSIDGGTFADCTNEATEIATASGLYFLDLTAGELNGDTIAILVKTSTTDAKTTVLVIYPVSTANAVLGVNVAAMAANTVNASAVAADAVAEIQSGLATASALTTVDTVVDAIQAKTDNLPADPAATSDIPTAVDNADALLKRDMSAVTGEASRSPLNSFRFIRNGFNPITGNTLEVLKEDDVTVAYTRTLTKDPNGEPIIGIN
jgi:hypothetical protein